MKIILTMFHNNYLAAMSPGLLYSVAVSNVFAVRGGMSYVSDSGYPEGRPDGNVLDPIQMPLPLLSPSICHILT